MALEDAPWWNDEIEVADLMWCAAHLHHIWDSRLNPIDDGQMEANERPPYPGNTLGSRNRAQDELPPISAPSRQETSIPLYPKGQSDRSEADRKKLERNQPASLIRVPDPFPFPDAREIGQAIAPLARRIAGTLRTELNVEATAIATAEANGLLSPVWQGPRERWLELHLLVDRSPSMAFWGDLSTDAADLFRWQGLFRDVRVWEFHTGDAAGAVLKSGGDAIEREVHSLHAPGHERIFLVLTDTLGRAWHSQKAFEWLGALGKVHPVHLAHIFPRQLWSSTALAAAILRPLKAPLAACANRKLQVEGRLPVEDNRMFRFPVFNLSDKHMGTWAQHVCAYGGNAIQGVLFEQEEEDDEEESEDINSGQDVENERDALAYFWTYASNEAQELAKILAALPLIPPVMRLAQQTFLSKSRYWHLAEVFFSGMVQKSCLGPEGKGVAESFYDFKGDYRKRLLKLSPPLQSVNVMNGMGSFIEQQYGSLRDFGALIPDDRGRLQAQIADGDLYFAKVCGSVLQLLGGEEAELGRAWVARADERERVLRGEEPVSVRDRKALVGRDGFPPLRELTFETGQFVELVRIAFPPMEEETVQVVILVFENEAESGRSDPQEGLEEFTFEIAKLERDSSAEGGWRVLKESGAAWKFEEVLDSDFSLEMVAIPAGEFLMGSPPNEPERRNSEDPQHEVRLEGFLMGRYPVTQKQWRFVAERCEQVNRPLEPSPARFKGARHPVERVSWFDAVEFCDRLSRHTKRTYRLPSEAEWEYACRAGTRTPFNFGDVLTADVANYYSSVSYNGSPTAESLDQTTSVDRYEIANAFGLCDMHGNVFEWCLDQWHGNYDNAPDDGSAWIDDNDNEKMGRIRRGGSWAYDPGYCRSAFRLNFNPRASNRNIGFRVVGEEPRALQ
ncbi:MAG: SAV_2336 N-terminal domain-related protein [Synechococcus sp.]